MFQALFGKLRVANSVDAAFWAWVDILMGEVMGDRLDEFMPSVC